MRNRFNLPQFVLSALLSSVALAQDQNAFHGADLAIVGRPYELTLSPGTHRIEWGDGKVEQVDGNRAFHHYQKDGVFEIRVQSADASGNWQDTPLDYAKLIGESKPAFYHAPSRPILSDSAIDLLTPLPLEGQNFPKILQVPADSFSIGCWLKLDTLSGKQVLFSSGGAEPGNCSFGMDEGNWFFEIKGAGRFAAPVVQMETGKWFHMTVTYDRIPLFPFSNQVRFFINGAPAGFGQIDAADPGPVRCESATMGKQSGGSFAGLAVYDSLLFPYAAWEQSRFLETPFVRRITVAKPGPTPFTVEEPQITTTVDVALDPDPAADNGSALREAIAAAQPGTRLRLVSKNGNQGGATFHIRSLVEGNKWASIPCENKTDFELDGNGCTILFADQVARFMLIDRSTRVAIRNLSFDLDQEYARVAEYARITSMNAETGEVKAVIVNGRDLKPVATLPQRASYWRWRPHDPKTFRLGNGKGNFTSSVYRNGEIPVPDPDGGPGAIRFHIKDGAANEAWDAIEKFSKAENFYQINHGDFKNTAVSLMNSSHVTFERVNYYAVLGMVFLSADVDHVRVVRCKIGLPPGMTAADRPLASGSDGYHFHLTRGKTLFEENEIALTDDDPISIKDSMWTKLSRLDDTRLDILTNESELRNGDTIELLTESYLHTGYKAIVKKKSGTVIELDKNLPAPLPEGTVLMNRSNNTRDWIIRDNYLHDYYGRVMLYKDHGSFINNRVHNSYYHLGISDASFERSGASGHAVTHRNLFVDTKADTSKWGGSQKVPVFQGITYSANSFLGRPLNLHVAQSPLVVRNWFQLYGETKEGEIISGNGTEGARISHNLEFGTDEKESSIKMEEASVEGNEFIAVPASSFPQAE